jgi:hypothetical protein
MRDLNAYLARLGAIMLVLVVLCVALAVGGCVTPMNDPEVILADNAATSAPHPRALLVARVQPSCVWWCTVTLSVNNSEGVKASGTAGDLTAEQSQTSVQTTTIAPTFGDEGAASPPPAPKPASPKQ